MQTYLDNYNTHPEPDHGTSQGPVDSTDVI